MYNWIDYNEKPVRRGEILISGDCFKNRDKELAHMKYHNDAIPAIKVRRNPSGRSGGCRPRKISAISQLTDYQHWKDGASCGKHWIAESVFPVPRRMFGEHVMAHKRHNMEKELKAALYNKFMSM